MSKTPHIGTTARQQQNSIDVQQFGFPYSIREAGASLELLKLDDGITESALNSWSAQLSFEQNGGVKRSRPNPATAKEGEGEEDDETESWGIVAQSRQRKGEEIAFLVLSFRRVMSSRLLLRNGRIERVEEESVEPELSEFHARRDGYLELYSFGSRQRTKLLESIRDSFGEGSVSELYLKRDAMKSLIAEALEVSSVSLTGLGNPFFSDASFSGTDPANSKTYKELMASGEIKSFRAKFQSSTNSSDAAAQPLGVSISSSKCKIRFYAGRVPVAQSDIEEFSKKVGDIATASSEKDGTSSF